MLPAVLDVDAAHEAVARHDVGRVRRPVAAARRHRRRRRREARRRAAAPPIRVRAAPPGAAGNPGRRAAAATLTGLRHQRELGAFARFTDASRPIGRRGRRHPPAPGCADAAEVGRVTRRGSDRPGIPERAGENRRKLAP